MIGWQSAFKSSQDLVDDFENLVQQVFTRADANGKANFVQEFENFKTACRKVPIVNSEKVEMLKKVESILEICKTPTAEPKETIFTEEAEDDFPKLPNELWMKILTYLPTYDIFASFALVNKHFHGLTLDPSAIKYLQIKDIDYHQVGKMKKVLKRCKNLKELSITKTIYDCDGFVMDAMEMTKNLESVKISVKTCNSSIERYRRAINKFFEINHKTLKKIDLRLSPEHCNILCNFSFTSLSLCQKLEHLSGAFHDHDMEWIFQARSLKKLELTLGGYELESVFDTKMDMPNLKCLSINGLSLGNDQNIDYDKLAKQHLPALEKLYLTSEDSCFDDSERATLHLAQLKKIVENFQNLVTIHIDEEPLPEVDVPNEYLYEIFKNYGILVIFGSIKERSKVQKNFEDFLEHDPLTLEKYKEAKCSHAKWLNYNHSCGYRISCFTGNCPKL